MAPKEQTKEMIDNLSNSLNVFYKPKDNDAIGLSIECCKMILDAISKFNYSPEYLTQREYWLDVLLELEDMQTKFLNPIK